MASMVFMVLYVIAALAMTAVVIFAWKTGEDIIDEDCPPIIGVLLAVIIGIGWPLMIIGIMTYLVKNGFPEETEES